MQTNAQIVASLKQSLADIRSFAISLFIKEMLERKNPKTGIAKYRIKNKTTGVDVTTVDAFIAAITDAEVEVKYPFGSIAHQTDRITGFNVIVNNLEARFTIKSEDDFINGEFIGAFVEDNAPVRFQFHMAYLNDGDTDLPLKVINVRLVR